MYHGFGLLELLLVVEYRLCHRWISGTGLNVLASGLGDVTCLGLAFLVWEIPDRVGAVLVIDMQYTDPRHPNGLSL